MIGRIPKDTPGINDEPGMPPHQIVVDRGVIGDQEDGMVRITHYPGMKGIDEANIDRWVAQVRHSDGTPSTRDDAGIKVTEKGNVRLTVADLSGNVKATMRATSRPNSRMIAAIVDHPQGPHFIVATGSIGTIQRWEGAIRAFLDSATAD